MANVQNNQQQLQPNTYLQKLTNITFRNILNASITHQKMSLQYLENYMTGLKIYKSQFTGYIKLIQEIIQRRKERLKNNEPTTVQRVLNWWVAIRFVFVFLSTIIIGGAYSITKIQLIENQILKQVLTGIVITVGIVMVVLIFKYIWPLRDIDKFKTVFQEEQN